MKKKLIALLVAVVLVLSVASVAACNKEGKKIPDANLKKVLITPPRPLCRVTGMSLLTPIKTTLRL